VKLSGQEFSDELVEQVQQAIDSEPGLTRVALSRRVCQWLGWRSANGRLKQMSCRLALLRLERLGRLRLPAVRGRIAKHQDGKAIRLEAPASIRCGLAELGPVELVRVGSADSQASRLWNGLMSRYHYLGAGPLCGAQIRYLIGSPRGWLGGLAFSAAAWRVGARDRWIGWSELARQQHLERVVQNSRFLILPQVRVPHLASHVLSLAARRLAADWQQRYGKRPWLLETFVEARRFRGTCYQAANWLQVGRTQGRGRQDRNHARTHPVKQVYLYRLDRKARQKLCRLAEGLSTPVPAALGPTPQDWAEAEFGQARLGDRRLQQRLLELARDFYARPQANIPQTCQTRARAKAAYRFLQHPRTQMDCLLQPHYESTRQRVSAHAVVLAVQDTTYLNYSSHPATENLGPIGTRPEGLIGLLLHSTMAFSLEGTPLGLLDAQCWARDSQLFGKKHRRHQQPIQQKESSKWLRSLQRVAEVQKQCPQTQLVSVGDREADIYELFHQALTDPQGPRLLVRAEQDRLLAEDNPHLWDHLGQQPVAGLQTVRIPRRSSRPAREAQLQVRFARVRLRPPRGRARLGELALWAVLAQETEAPQGVAPLGWLLLTTCPVQDFDQAIEKIHWYTLRWGIEVYHRTLKSGCRIEQRQLGSADRIEACLAIDLVVGWRIFHLAKLGRETPDVPCTVFFEEAEWKALLAYVTRNPVPSPQPPTLRQAIHLTASLGGFLGRKGDGQPGTQTLWLGLQRLDDLTSMWTFLTQIYAPHMLSPPVSSNGTYG
jgi:hypothetical protein